MGLNPYYNGMALEHGEYNLLKLLKNNLEDGITEIKKIKKCILDGYKFNMVVWDDTSKKYILHHRNIPVQITRNNVLSRMGDDAVQRNANFIVASEIMLSESQKNPGMYEFQASEPISIMDTLNIDLKFLLY
jgi:tRNA A37 methylthiotransferase MiaB